MSNIKEELEKEFKIDNKISREDLIKLLESLSYRQLERCNFIPNIPIVVDEYINKQFKPHPTKTEPKPNPLPNYRNPPPPPPPPVYKAPVDRSGSEGRVFHDVVQCSLEETTDDDDTPTTLILLISIIILLGYIIYQMETYFKS